MFERSLTFSIIFVKRLKLLPTTKIVFMVDSCKTDHALDECHTQRFISGQYLSTTT